MTINFRKNRVKFRGNYAGLCIIIGIIAILFNSEPIFIYPWLILGFLEICIWYYEYKYHYLQIQDNILTINSFVSKSIDLTQIKAIKKYKSIFVLESEKQRIKIHKSMIDTESLHQLSQFLNKIQLLPITHSDVVEKSRSSGQAQEV